MFRYIVRRLLQMIPILFGITLITFIIINAAGSPLQNMEFNPRVKPEDIERIRHNLGLDEPVWKRYFIWVGNVLRGDLGLSLINFRPVTQRIQEVMFNTLLLSVVSTTISLAIAVPLGIYGATHRNGIVDRVTSVLSVAGYAIPTVWLGLLLIILFSIQFEKWGFPSLPVGGVRDLRGDGGIQDRIEHLILPVTALVIPQVGIWLFWVRSNMLEVLGQDYMRAARARGLRERSVLYRHGLRNALIPLVTIVGLSIPDIFAGALVVENVFAYPGMGRLTITAIGDKDHTLVMGITLIFAVLVIVGNLIADLLYAVAILGSGSIRRAWQRSPTMIQTDQTFSGSSDPFIGDTAEERVPVDFEGLGRSRPIESNWHRAWRRFKANRLALLALIITIAIFLFAIAAPLVSYFTGFNYYENHLGDKLAAPGQSGYILGADGNGRDLLTRLAYGGRVSLLVAGLATVSLLVIGGTIGSVAGYFGGWADTVLMRSADVLLSIPTLVLLILVSSFYHPSPWQLAVLIAVVSWAGISRIVRGQVLTLKNQDFVDASRVIGASDQRIIIRHLMPNIIPQLIIWSALAVPSLILTEATLSYLGLGVQAPQPSWGNMLQEAKQFVRQSWTFVFIPGFMIFLTALCTYLVGLGLRDALDPRLND